MFLYSGRPLVRERHSIRGSYFYCCHRPLYRVCAAHFPAPVCNGLQAWTVALGSLEQADWLDCCDLGCLHFGAVYVAYPQSCISCCWCQFFATFNYTPVVVLGVFLLV